MLPETRLSRTGRSASAPAALYTFALFAFIVATRWPLAPRYLYYFDSANFALALEKFSPAQHQPQPPGYPLFVALTRLIHVWIASAEQVMVIAGLLAACAATLLIYRLGSELFGRTAAILSAALLASNPVFWFAGVTNQIRLFLAVSALGISLLAWRALRRPENPAALWIAFGALGVAAGFRPVQAVLLLPLLFWVWLRTGRSIPRLVWAMGALFAAVLPWAIVTTWAMGGVRSTIETLWAYANDQFQGSSAVFGASRESAYHMFVTALVWNVLGSVSWVWALPLLKWRRLNSNEWEKAVFLGLIFLPPFLFSAIIHIGDPDQGLGSIPVLSVVGGAFLAAYLHKIGSRRVFTAAALVLISHIAIFFFPPGKIARAASYKAVRDVDRMTIAALTSIEFLKQGKPVTIVHYGSSVASRQVEYYFPDDYLVVLPGTPANPNPAQSPRQFYRHSDLPLPAGAAGALRPGSRRIICLPGFHTPPLVLPGWQSYGPVFYKDVGDVPDFKIGPFTLVHQ